MHESQARDELVRAAARLGARGLIASTEGNLSCRLGDRIVITPAGRRKDELAPGDMVVLALDRTPADAAAPRPSSDVAIHLAVYRARPDVGAAGHAHRPASMGLTLAGEAPDAGALPATAAALGRVPLVALEAMGSAALAARVANALVEPPEPLPVALLLERHGAVAVGDDPAIGVDRLELLEVLCQAWRDALFVRAARAVLDRDPA